MAAGSPTAEGIMRRTVRPAVLNAADSSVKGMRAGDSVLTQTKRLSCVRSPAEGIIKRRSQEGLQGNNTMFKGF